MYVAHAVRCWCFGRNTQVRDGDSSWNLRHKKGQFTGPKIPFGAAVNFKLSPISKQKKSKFSPDSQVGIFFGYVLQPGGVWKSEFYVVPLAGFVGISLHKDVKGSDVQVHVQRVRECAIETDEKGKPLDRIPLKEKYDRTNRTIEGLEAAAGINDALFDCPPEAPDALAVPDVVDASAVDNANEQVGFEGLVLESGGDEEGVVF